MLSMLFKTPISSTTLNQFFSNVLSVTLQSCSSMSGAMWTTFMPMNISLVSLRIRVHVRNSDGNSHGDGKDLLQ